MEKGKKQKSEDHKLGKWIKREEGKRWGEIGKG